jgi:hypothetical protein
MAPKEKPEAAKPSMLQITWSMIAAFCGVQNDKNHERDFAYIDEVGFKPYIIIGVLLTLVILFVLYAIVQIILS